MSDRDKIITVLKASLNIKIPDIISWLIGIKPVIYASPEKDLVPLLRSLFPEIKALELSAGESGRQFPVIFFSKDQQKLHEAARCLKKSRSSLGELLGYPRCCIEAHEKMCLTCDFRERERISTFESAKRSVRPNFLLNNLLSFVTRLYDPNLMNNYYLNRDQKKHLPIIDGKPLTILDFSFISHIPCRYDCSKSLEIAQKVDAWLLNNIPELQGFMKERLARPFLIFNTLNWIAFDGVVKNGCLNYKSIIQPYAPVKNEATDYIRKGDRLFIDNDKIIISKGEEKLFLYKKSNERDGYLIDFGV